MSNNPRITITELAAAAGVSVCTVNNALTGKGRMSAPTRDKVLAAADRLGYRPNRMAQALARNPIRLVVVYPDRWPGFYAPLAAGAVQAAGDLRDRRVTSTTCRLAGDASEKQMLRAIQRAIRPVGRENIGVILCVWKPAWAVLADRLAAARIPVVLLGIDLPGAPRIALVRHDAERSGRIAAELLGCMVTAAPLAIVIGSRTIGDHCDKVRGFETEARRCGVTVAGVFETQDDPAQGFPVTARMFKQLPEIGGIYVATDNSAGICKYLRQHQLAGRVKLAVTGVFPEMGRQLENGTVQFALYQRMHTQGRLAAEALYRNLAEGISPPPEILIPPLIATRNNLDVIGNEPATADLGQPASVEA